MIKRRDLQALRQISRNDAVLHHAVAISAVGSGFSSTAGRDNEKAPSRAKKAPSREPQHMRVWNEHGD